jgi:methylated-DNA-[protein]-cysteine S-methyltransferase
MQLGFPQQSIETPLGPVLAVWNARGLERIVFSTSEGHSPAAASRITASSRTASSITANPVTAGHTAAGDASTVARAARLSAGLAAYFAGGELVLPLEDCDFSDVPEFHRRVLFACARIPRGATRTYGQLAASVGSPGAARAVGQAMARNRWPLVIPCHRVLGASGQMTGYSGRGGIDTKRALLAFEKTHGTHYGLAGVAEPSRVAARSGVAEPSEVAAEVPVAG